MGRTRVLYGILAFQALTAASSCAAESREPLPRHAALLVLPGATNIEQQSRDGIEAVQYDVGAPFPAFGAIQTILKHMSEKGWMPLHEDWLNPGIPTSYVRSWTDFADRSVRPWVHRYSWSTSWKNARGDLATYQLRYVLPHAGRPPLARLTVSASVAPALAAERIKAQAEAISRINERSGLPTKETGPTETMLRIDAKPGDALLLSNHLGEAIILVVAARDRQVSYRWRFREAESGVESGGTVPLASIMNAGPFQLSWMPTPPTEVRGKSPWSSGVSFYAREMDIIPLPSGFFESLDLGEIRRLASLTSIRDEQFRAHQAPPETRRRSRRIAFHQAGMSLLLRSGDLLLVESKHGRGVVEFEVTGSDSVNARWRFRDAKSGRETSGIERMPVSTALFVVGPHELMWMTRSVTPMKSEGATTHHWIGEVSYFPEEVACSALGGLSFSSVDLSKESRRTP